MRTMAGIALAVFAAAAQEAPDAIYHNGVVYTVDANFSATEAIAVRDGQIAAVGTSDDLLATISADTKRIDLQGRAVVPGLIDAHGHMLGLGQSLQNLDLVGTESLDAIIMRVSDRVANTRAGDWILGRGWDQNDWPDTAMPSHEPLTARSPDNPVVLGRIGGHASLVNAAAMTIAGIDRDTPDPPGGKILRNTNGDPTGVLLDTAQSLVGNHVPRESEAQTREALRLAVDACLRVGLTGVHDAGVSPAMVETYKAMIDDGAFDFRVYAMVRGSNADELRGVFANGPIIGYGGGRLTVRCIKVMSDGALGSRGAALRAPYNDDPGNTGLLIVDEPTMTELTKAALRAKFQVATHAIGDLANHAALNAFESAMKAVPNAKDPRLRIEHAQVIALEDIPRFAELGVIPSMQATHATSDMPWAPKRLGPDRTRGAYAWRKLMDAGARIANGSDFPVENNNPLWGLYAAITRQDHKGQPQDAWQPEERMTREEALRSFTIGAAYAAFEENVKGSLEPGKLADFVVFDRDVMKIPAAELLETNVVMTVLGGEVAYEK